MSLDTIEIEWRHRQSLMEHMAKAEAARARFEQSQAAINLMTSLLVECLNAPMRALAEEIRLSGRRGENHDRK